MNITFQQYQELTNETAVYPKKDALTYLTLGLVGEAGEIANKVKKIIRDDDGIISLEKENEILSEIGDVLWYAAQLCEFMNLQLEEAARVNLKKLFDRKERNALHGSGDNR